MERKITKPGKSYWDNNGAYQKEYSKLHNELVPASGASETKHGELLRCIGNLFYDFCNNGNCNAVESVEEECPECHGGGYETTIEDGEEVSEDCSYCDGHCKIQTGNEVVDHYKEQLEYIQDNLPKDDKKLVDELEEFMCRVTYGRHKFDDDEMGYYNKVADAIMYLVLTTENSPR